MSNNTDHWVLAIADGLDMDPDEVSRAVGLPAPTTDLERDVRKLSDKGLLRLAATTHDPIILLTVLDELRARRPPR